MRPAHAMRVAAVLLALATLGAGLLWIVPQSMDWNSHRGAIARFAAEKLGRPVSIDGPIMVAFLPAPIVIAERVRLGDRGDGISLSAPALRLRLALAPLLLGRAVPRALVLSHPTIRLPWPLPPAALTGGAPWPHASVARIDDGLLDIGLLHLTGLAATLRVSRADPGGVAVAGSARLGRHMLRFTQRLGLPDAAGDLPFEVAGALDPPGADLARADLAGEHLAGEHGAAGEGRFIGLLRHDGALGGHLTAAAADLSRLLPIIAGPARLDGALTMQAAGTQAQLDLTAAGTRMTIGLAPQGDGHGEDALLVADRLDLDGWLRALHVAQARHREIMLPLPWPAAIDLSITAATLRGSLLRNVHVKADIEGARTYLRSVAAMLPGEAAASLHGTLSSSGDPVLDVSWALDAPQLRATLAWLTRCGLALPADLPPAVLRQAALTGHAVITAARVDLDGIAGSIEQSTVGGHIGVETATGALDAALRLDHLPLDNWAANPAALRWDRLSPALTTTSLALKLEAGEATYRGEILTTLVLDAATDAGGLALNGADFDVDGLHAHLSGTLDRDGQASGGSLDLTGPAATTLAARLPAGLRFTDLLWSGPVRLHVDAAGPRNAMIVSANLDLADAHLETHPTIDWTSGAWRAQLTLRHPGATRLLGALGWPGAQGWLGEGSLSLLAQLSGAPGAVGLDNFDLTAGALHATGSLQFGPRISGQINADTLPLPALAVQDRAPLPWAWLRPVVASLALSANTVQAGDREMLHGVSARLELADGMVLLTMPKASSGGGTVTAEAAMDIAATPPRFAARAAARGVRLAGALQGGRPDLTSGQFDASLDLAAMGYSPAAILASLSGAVRLQAAAGSFVGIDDASPRPFDMLTAAITVRLGIATLDQAVMTGAAGARALSGSVNLEQWLGGGHS